MSAFHTAPPLIYGKGEQPVGSCRGGEVRVGFGAALP